MRLLVLLLMAAVARAQSGFANGLHYEVAGSGHPLVFIHGGQLDSRMWDDQFAAYAKSYRVIRYDVRGFGKSPASTSVFADEEDLAGLLKALNVQKAFVVGLSLGGRIAIDLMLAHPDLVDAAVLVAPGLSGFHFSGDPNDAASWRAAQAGDWETVAHYWLISGYMAPAMSNSKIAPRIHQLALENAHENLDNAALERVLDPPAIDRLASIHVPTLIVVGNRDVVDIHEISGLLYARIPGAKEVVIDGAGHMVNMEKPVEFDRAVLAFLHSQ
jgi:3-oxoadipate enol-lactonase